MRTLRWAAPTAVIAVAFALRFWALDRPGVLVFDELYYVRDAISQLAHGFPTVWPDDDPDMSGARAMAFTDDPSYAVHPPLGKWLIGLGVLLFGAGDGWGWRSAVALAGVATVAVTMLLGYRLSRSPVIAWTAGLLLAIDGVHVTLSRVALLDGFLAFFVVLGALFVWLDQERVARDPSRQIAWRRPWLLAAGLAFGAATAVKWSGLYPLAFFLVLITVWDAAARFREARDLRGRTHRGSSDPVVAHAPQPRPLLGSALQAAATAAIALPAALLAYLASWTGWIAAPDGWGSAPGVPWPVALWRYHAEMLAWHGTLSAPHPYQAHPFTWPLALRPTAMYEIGWGPDQGCAWSACVSGITPLPNPIVTWAGVAALWALAWLALREARTARGAVSVPGTAVAGSAAAGSTAAGSTVAGSTAAARDPLIAASVFVIVGYLSGWLPWLLTFSRSAVFQFYAVVLAPFSALALALVLGMLCGIRVRGPILEPAPSMADAGVNPPAASDDADALQGRRAAVACFLSVAVVLALLFFPVWSGMPVAEWFWRAHMWLPGWS